MDPNHRPVHIEDPRAAKQPPAAKAPGTGRAVARLERKGRSGKTVTVLERLAVSDHQLHAFLRELQTRCGTGGTIKEHRIELQGDRLAAARIFLLEKGYRVG